MSTETRPTPTGLPDDEYSLHLRGFDREVNVVGVLVTGLAVALTTLLSFLACWYGLKLMERLDEKHEATVTAIEEAAPQGPAPLPALQISPEDDLQTMRAEEKKRLENPAWDDKGKGTVDLKIEDAMDALVRRGVAPLEGAPPAPAAGTAAPPPAATPPAASAAAPAATPPPATPPPAHGGARP